MAIAYKGATERLTSEAAIGMVSGSATELGELGRSSSSRAGISGAYLKIGKIRRPCWKRTESVSLIEAFRLLRVRWHRPWWAYNSMGSSSLAASNPERFLSGIAAPNHVSRMRILIDDPSLAVIAATTRSNRSSTNRRRESGARCC